MNAQKMDAREYLDCMKDDKDILWLARYQGQHAVGRGYGAMIDREHSVAIMLTDCGMPEDTGIRAGDFVVVAEHPEGEPRIIGTPARIRD